MRARLKAELKARAENSLYDFFRQAWHAFDPAEFQGNWHLEMMAAHLEAVTKGKIKRLIINVPPRTAKTSLIGIAWPVWTWLQQDISTVCGPRASFVFAGYSHDVALKSAEKSRRLLFSKWFQENWPDRFSILADSNRKDDFTNDKGGSRFTTSVSGTLTGMGGDVIVGDDLNSAKDSQSKAVRDSTNEWWDEALSTRLNDPKIGAYVVVQQRLHEDDITGHILSTSAENWTHLMYPMRFDARRASSSDIRTEDGDLLWPERFGEVQVAELEKRLGPYAAAGQLQQSPMPRGGGIIKREWWQLWELKNYPLFNYIIGSLDTAMTSKDSSDYSALTIWGAWQDPLTTAIAPTLLNGHITKVREDPYGAMVPKVMLAYAWRDRLDLPALVSRLLITCKKYKIDCLVIENKAHGHAVYHEIVVMLAEQAFSVILQDPRRLGDKESRLYAVQHLFSEGLIYAPDKEWADAVITEVSQFPRGANDDFVDSTSMGLHFLRARGFANRREEATRDAYQAAAHKGRAVVPLYPG